MMIHWLLLAAMAGGDVVGVVRSDPSGEPVPHARVRVAGLARATVADERGFFVLRDVAAGERRLHVSALGHDTASIEVAVRDGERVRVEIRLPERTLALAPVTVEGAQTEGLQTAGPGAVRLGSADIRALPALAEPDVLRVVQSLPSVAAASDFSSAMYVRGGSPDQTLITVDGAPLFNPYHLGGLVSAIDANAVASTEVHAGALPASMGDRLSGAVEIWTRDGGRDRFRFSGASGLLSARVAVDGPLPGRRGSILVSARRTYVDAAVQAARRLQLTDRSFPYSFSDVHVKATHDVGSTGRVSAALYANDEGFRLPPDWGAGRTNWGWGSRAASADYRQMLGGAWLFRARASLSAFDGRLTSVEPDDAPLQDVATSAMRHRSARGELAHVGARHRITLGAGAELIGMRHEVTPRGFGEIEEFLSPLSLDDEVRTVSAFAEGELRPAEPLRVRAGVRAMHVSGGATVLMPRAGLRYTVSPALSLTLGGGSYAQAVASLRDEESVAAGLFAYDLLAAAPAGRPARSRDVVAGAQWNGGGLGLRVEAYRRWFDDLLVPPLARDPRRAPALAGAEQVEATGSAAGLEVLARHVRGGRTLSLSYAWMAAERRADTITYVPRSTRRHTLDASAALPFGRAGQLGARLQYASGQPFTRVAGRVAGHHYDPERGVWVPAPGAAVYGPHNAERLPSYLRVDAGVRRSWPVRWLGSDGVVTPYLEVLNLLSTRNVMWAAPGSDGGDLVLDYGPQLPVLPTFGVEWRF